MAYTTKVEGQGQQEPRDLTFFLQGGIYNDLKWLKGMVVKYDRKKYVKAGFVVFFVNSSDKFCCF